VCMENVVQCAVLQSQSQDEDDSDSDLPLWPQTGQGEGAQRGTDDKPQCPTADAVRVFKEAGGRSGHGAKERPTPEKGMGPVSLLDCGGISPWLRP